MKSVLLIAALLFVLSILVGGTAVLGPRDPTCATATMKAGC